MIRRSTAISNNKGGVGKTVITAHLAGLAAEAGYRVLVVDLDPQGSLGRDLNYARTAVDDSGKELLTALQFGHPLKPIKDVRPGLDVVCGGAYVDDLIQLEPNFARRGRDSRLVLEKSLAPVAQDYHLILIDCPPGGRYLQTLSLSTVQYVVIPTRSDDASLDGLSGVAAGFEAAREVNPELELLGVVLFGIGTSATVIQREVREKIDSALGGVAPVFESQIRYLEAPAVESRNRGMLAYEYERDLVSQAPSERRRLRKKARDGQSDRIAPTAGKLAGDYAALATEFLNAIMSKEQNHAAAAGGAS